MSEGERLHTNWYKYSVNRATGKVHRVIMSDGTPFTPEECNLDDLAEPAVDVTAEYAAAMIVARPGARCGHCWPTPPETASDVTGAPV